MEQQIRKILMEHGAGDGGCTTGFLCGIFPYLPKEAEKGNLSLYARGLDYHNWVKHCLEQAAAELRQQFPGYDFRCYCDVSPYDEVTIAHRCGLGVLGKNRLLITPQYGSYVFIGLIATDMPLPDNDYTEGCINCGACARLCPTAAITEQGICTERCLSHISQRRGELNKWEQTQLKKSPLIWGCDSCQLVCPMNKGKQHSQVVPLCSSLSLAELEGLSDKQFRRNYQNYAFSFRGIQPLKRNLLLKEKSE